MSNVGPKLHVSVISLNRLDNSIVILINSERYEYFIRGSADILYNTIQKYLRFGKKRETIKQLERYSSRWVRLDKGETP